ncbi:hypothetical protein AGMMS49944_30850 [Spirochaetia bacterium]|nr:hypothetical protein AGMMS49944_30850 [Spirochaetia bacterium]
MNSDSAVESFLRLLRNLPAELMVKMPVLSDIADMSSGITGTQPGLVRRRLDRRYARISVVHAELGKLDFKKAKPGIGLEDMVFAQTDFDRYKKISREDFNTFFDEGLDDFTDVFYKNNCMMDRGAVRKAIFHWYHLEEEHYYCAVVNPLLLGIMRTLHISLDFAPLLRAEETRGECEILIRYLQSQSALGDDALSDLTRNFPLLFSGLIRSLNTVTVIHPDGMTTTLSLKNETPPVLYGTFHPANKAHTIRLI